VSTTPTNLKTRIATVLLDPSAKTFTAGLLSELLYSGLVELGRLVPAQYVEDLDPVANQIAYQLGTSIFASGSVDIEPQRVEVWDASADPDALIYTVNPAATEYGNSDAGWSMWNGYLYLPTRVVRGLQGYESTYVIRVWGYAPYALPDSEDDVLPISVEVEQAIIKFARLEGLELLKADRDLFSQWQTRSGNTDVSYAGLLNSLSQARADWRQYSRAIQRLRAPV
jgi:hypothetical protein